jgi:hypothetical protein
MVTKSGAVAPGSVKVTWVKPPGVGFEEAAIQARKVGFSRTPLYKGIRSTPDVQTIRFQMKD